MENIIITWEMLCFIGQVIKYIEIDKKRLRLKPDNFERYGIMISFNSNFLTKISDTDQICKILSEFNKKINELKSDCLAGQDKEIMSKKNDSLIYNNKLKLFDDCILKDEKKLQQDEYLTQDHNRHHYQCDFHHKKLLPKD